MCVGDGVGGGGGLCMCSCATKVKKRGREEEEQQGRRSVGVTEGSSLHKYPRFIGKCVCPRQELIEPAKPAREHVTTIDSEIQTWRSNANFSNYQIWLTVVCTYSVYTWGLCKSCKV